MVINKVSSDSGSAVISLSISEISILANALYKYVNSESNSISREVKELHKDFYLFYWLAKDGRLCSDDLKIALDILGTGEERGKINE